MKRIVIVGGHGKIAMSLAELLSGRGHHVHSLIRNPDQEADISATGAVPVVADIEALSAEELSEIFTGNDAIVFAAGAGGGSPERTYSVDRDAAIRTMDAAAHAGVHRYVVLSYRGASLDHGVPEDNDFFAYAEAKAAADDHLRKGPLRYTIVGPGALSSEPASGKIDVGDAATAEKASRENVAHVIAAVIDSDNTIGHTIEFMDGSTQITDAVAAIA
ncbi:putative NAD(P)-binding protein [Rhodoglobus vestalii]|uniref:Putative NAD(P)-binding protein n=1 Tax=Rhodoglobus vestalii TaxID=193384 RepID=A0A8H2K6X0_9MICO|nr:NAD(P)H-binding protein [Rhodoglobus vestalii]TQO19112.1 putative NAD(P)-binding protein [Rhodoglobus vestalii]